MIFGFLVLVIAFIFVYGYNHLGKMISKDVENIENITITVYPYDKEKIETTIVNNIETVYDILNKTTKIRNTYTELPQWDPKFKIDIFYKNGEKEQIFSTETTGSIYKYSNNEENSAIKYRIGDNQLIWEYVFNQ